MLKENVIIALITAFSTGFAVFLSTRTSDFMKRLLDRKVKHYNAIVFYEEQLNQILSRLYDVVFVIPNIKQALSQGAISWNNIKTIDFDRSLLVNIHSRRLRNLLALFMVDIYKLNDDIESLMGGYQELKAALIAKTISHQEYQLNADGIVANLNLIERFTNLTIEKTIDAITEIRLRIRYDKPKTSLMISKIIEGYMKPCTDDEYQDERKKVLKEIEEVSKQRREEINKAIGQSK